MKKIPDAERAARYHIGALHEFDDFLWLWDKFVEDDVWEAAGHPRLFSEIADHAYITKGKELLDFLFAKFNDEFTRAPKHGTVFIEFARGASDGGYTNALNRLSDELLSDAAILFIDASYEESCRRNDARYQEKLKHSVLAHKVPEADMVRFSRDIDWPELTHNQPHGLLPIRQLQVPFLTMDNETELKNPAEFRERCRVALDALMTIFASRTEKTRMAK